MTPDRGLAARPSRALLALFALPLVAGLVEAIRRAWVCDDIFITFRYVDQWSRGNGLVYNAGERVEGYTHFLWAIVLAALHRLGLDLVTLGRYLPIVAYAAVLAILFVRAVRSGTGGLAVPLAAWGLALHKDAQIYASSGLETSVFGLVLLVGLLVATGERERVGLAACVYAVAALVRPEGVLYAGVAGAYVLWRWRDVRRAARFAGVWAALFAPFLAWRVAYYHSWLPNTYYAKSASVAWWSQGWWYTRYYFGIYSVLPACILVAGIAWAVLLHRRPAQAVPVAGANARIPGARRPHDLALLGSVQILLTVLYVTRLGGDFMFARFYIPVTPFVYLLCEDALRHLGRARLLAAAAVVGAGLTFAARIPRDRIFVGRDHVHSMTDEPNFYTRQAVDLMRRTGEKLGRCIEGTDARLGLLPGQDGVAYFGHLEYALEQNGLTDTDIAHLPLRQRGRPGHEKLPTPELLDRKHIHFRLLYGFSVGLSMEMQIRFDDLYGQIVYWDGDLMRRLASKPGVNFLDFPTYVDRYIEQVGTKPRQRLLDDYVSYQRFYFLHNSDPKRLQRLRLALLATGIAEESLQARERAAAQGFRLVERKQAP